MYIMSIITQISLNYQVLFVMIHNFLEYQLEIHGNQNKNTA